MYAQRIVKTSYQPNNILKLAPTKQESEKKVKNKKNGTPKKTTCNKKKGKKSEVFAFSIEEMKKVIAYFEEEEKWQCYLVFILSCNMARRVGDILALTWEYLFNPNTGKIRADLLEIVEDKTDKFANPHINSACRNAIELYIERTGFNPADNSYKNSVFVQDKGNYKGRVLTYGGYYNSLKKAAKAVGVENNVGTHSPRKTFGMMTRMLHPNDYDSMELLQSIYNHTDTKTTNRYIGLTKKKIDVYYDDMGNFFDNYITGDKIYTEVASTPVVSLDTNDLRDIITAAYKAGQDNAGKADAITHIEAINNIMAMIEQLKK